MSNKVLKPCPICAEEFVSYKSQNRKTCSLKCSYIQRGLDKTINLVGEVFGELVVVEYVGSINGKVVWKCLCSCGRETEVSAGDLKRKDGRKVTTCGDSSHTSGENSKHWKGSYGISASYFRSLKEGAKIRGLCFEIDYKDMAEVFTGYCALSGIPIELGKEASLDRIDSTLGYLPNNIQWLHKDVNKIKSNLNQEYFINLCRKIAGVNNYE